jgi:hypothetical protein
MSGQTGAVVAGASHSAAADTAATTAINDFSDLLALACGPVSFLDRVGFGHVLTLLGRAVKARSFPVVHM